MGVFNGPNISTDNLVLCVDAGNTKSYPGTGTSWVDLSDQGNNGTLTNGPTFSSSDGGSIVFDGTNDYVDLGDNFNLATGTFDFWFNLDNSPASTDRIWGKNQNFECRWTGTPQFVVDLGASSSITSTKTDWSAGQWYNITLTWNSSSNVSTLYVQGAQDTTGTATSPVGLTGNFRIGSSLDNSAYMDGKVAIFKVYNTVLTSAQVAENYNANRSRFGL